MLIGQVADRAGVPAKTIRYYESIQLLPAAERGAKEPAEAPLVSGDGEAIAAVLGSKADSDSAGLALRVGELALGLDPSPRVEVEPVEADLLTL